MRMFIRLKLCYWREKIHPWQYQDCPHLRSAPVPIIWIKMLTSGPDWALGPALHAVQRAFFGSCKEPSKSLCCFCVCVFVFKTEFRLSLAMNESWMGHKCVSRQSCSVMLWCWMMLYDAEWWFLIKQEPHDQSVLLTVEWYREILIIVLTARFGSS